MSRDNQIEEMVRDVCKLGISCNDCNAQGECVAEKYALRFYNAGYRKQSEGELIYEVNHFFDDYGDLIVYVFAHCAECGTPYRENRNVDYERIERPDNLDYHADWNIDVEPIKKRVLERAKTRKLSQNFCPNCGAKMKGGAE